MTGIAKSVCALIAAVAMTGCSHQTSKSASATATKAPAEHWVSLFDGKDLKGWHNYKQPVGSNPVNWEARDGNLINTTHGPDLITDGSYGNFVLEMDFKMPPHGNSGIMYRCDESAAKPWQTGPEYQLWDNANGPGTGVHECAAVYDLYPPTTNAAKPAGEWNHAKLVVDHNHVEHWVNGTKVAEYDFNSDDWNGRVAKSKFHVFPKFGKLTRGQIALQGDHSPKIEFKDVRIRDLDAK